MLDFYSVTRLGLDSNMIFGDTETQDSYLPFASRCVFYHTPTHYHLNRLPDDGDVSIHLSHTLTGEVFFMILSELLIEMDNDFFYLFVGEILYISTKCRWGVLCISTTNSMFNCNLARPWRQISIRNNNNKKIYILLRHQTWQ